MKVFLTTHSYATCRRQNRLPLKKRVLQCLQRLLQRMHVSQVKSALDPIIAPVVSNAAVEVAILLTSSVVVQKEYLLVFNTNIVMQQGHAQIPLSVYLDLGTHVTVHLERAAPQCSDDDEE